MNFKSEMALLLADASKHVVESKGHKIISAPVYSKGKLLGYHFYSLNQKDKKNNLLGQGSFGQVYKVYPLDKQGNPILDQPCAMKIFGDPQYFNEKEAIIFSRYYRAENPIKTPEATYLIMELLPGIDLFNDEDQLNPAFQHLTFDQTIELIHQICLAMNLLHHKTPSTGSAVSHSDIKGQNIKVDINTETGCINVYILDFGLTEEIEDNPHAQITNQRPVGTPLYAPSESYFNLKRGIKSDIYALVPIITILLGGEPFGDKTQALDEDNDDKLYLSKYLYTKFLNKFSDDVNLIPLPLTKILLQFLDRMQSDYDKRPDSDETLKFFTALNNCVRVNHLTLSSISNSPNLLNQFAGYAATLILIAFNLWSSDRYRHSLIDSPSLSVGIIDLLAHNNLSEESLLKLENSEQSTKIVGVKSSQQNRTKTRKKIQEHSTPLNFFEKLRDKNITNENINRSEYQGKELLA